MIDCKWLAWLYFLQDCWLFGGPDWSHEPCCPWTKKKWRLCLEMKAVVSTHRSLCRKNTGQSQTSVKLLTQLFNSSTCLFVEKLRAFGYCRYCVNKTHIQTFNNYLSTLGQVDIHRYIKTQVSGVRVLVIIDHHWAHITSLRQRSVIQCDTFLNILLFIL